jgi:tetratricopeptide (TPR) repeat protein
MKLTRLKLLLILGSLAGVLAVGYATSRARRPPLPHDKAFALGQKQLEDGKFREAYSHLSHAARVHPEDSRYHWGAAQAAMNLGHVQAAGGHARDAWTRGFRNRDVFLLLVRTAPGERSERLAKGLGWLRELPDSRERRELEGDLHQSAGQYPECLRIWTELFDASPVPSLANKIALGRVAMGKPETAHEFLKSCRSAGRLDEEGYGLLASLAAYRDDAEEAAAVFAEGRKRNESGESLRLTEAVFLIWQDRLAEAGSLLEPLKGRSREPAQAALHAQARIFLGFLRGAQADLAALQALSALAEGEGPALEGERIYYQGLKERSVETLKRARLLMKEHPACEWAFARELARSGAWKESAAAFRGITGLLARAPVLQVELAHVLRRSGKADEAFGTLHRLHARRFYSKASLELFRDIAIEKGLSREAGEAQAYLEKRFRDDPSVLMAGGVLALRSGNLTEAASILEGLAGRHPEREDVEQARLSVLFARKDYEGVLKAAAASRAPAAALAPIQAAALVMLGRDSEASGLYERILSERREPWTLLSYANLLLRLDKVDRAAELYGEVLRLQPGSPVARLGLASLAVRRRDWKSARTNAEAATSGRAIAYAYVLLAEIELEEGRPDRALASCNRALGLAPKDERAGFLLGVANLELGRYDEAETILQPRAAARPDAAHLQWQLARVRMSRGAFGEALAVVDGALSRRLPGEIPFQVMRLVLLARMGRAEDARGQFSSIASNLPPERAVLCDAWLLQQEGRTADAVARLREHLQDPHVAICWAEVTLMDGRDDGVLGALDRHSLDAGRWGRIGELARQKGFMATAAGGYRRALRSDPENPQLLNNYAFASLQLESFDEPDVLAAARKACAILPGNPSVIHTYATALLRCRKEQECIELLDKSPAATQRSARLLHAHAVAHERLQHWSLALKSYAACLAHPETEGVKAGDLARLTLQRRIDQVKSKMETR